MELLGDFHRNGVFKNNLNATFISLLPKLVN